ncbi:hypothetical protein TNCV_4639491 [Trichonephila clavipes]|nr:hypothetical protein TNCV_4639491 [Trichonephila clavipes]
MLKLNVFRRFTWYRRRIRKQWEQMPPSERSRAAELKEEGSQIATSLDIWVRTILSLNDAERNGLTEAKQKVAS